MEDLELLQCGNNLHLKNWPEGTHLGLLSLDEPFVRRVADMWLHLQDLRFARRSLAAIGKGIDDEHIQQALWRSAIVHFFKCFQSSESRPCKLNADAVFKGHPSEAMENYQFFYSLRNKHIVHDENSYSQCHPAALINDGGKGYKIEKVVTFSIGTDSLTPPMFTNMCLMTDAALAYVAQQYDILAEKITSQLEQRPLEELRALPMLQSEPARPEDVHEPR